MVLQMETLDPVILTNGTIHFGPLHFVQLAIGNADNVGFHFQRLTRTTVRGYFTRNRNIEGVRIPIDFHFHVKKFFAC